MIGMVFVSHSSKIAEGIVDLAGQMVHGRVKLIAAGGTNDNRIGTDASKIMEAIIEADDGDGVLVLVDLGSAIMSTEMAIELLDEDLQQRVVIADAPIVEGAIGAAVQASIESDLSKVKKTAEEARLMHKKG